VAFFKANLQGGAVATGPTVRLRGTLLAIDSANATMRTRNGEVVTMVLPANLTVNETYAVKLSDIKAGSFVGVGSMPQPDGSQRALGITVFPESARGTNEGHYPYDIAPGAMMTNATVDQVAAAPDGRRLRVRYKDGEKTILVPPGTNIVSFKPGDRSLLVPGAGIAVTVREVDGKPTALRISAGRQGVNPN
jgi:hypothetical protein